MSLEYPDSRTLWCSRNYDPGMLTITKDELLWKPRIIRGKPIVVKRSSVTKVDLQRGCLWPDRIGGQYKEHKNDEIAHINLMPGTATYVIFSALLYWPFAMFTRRWAMTHDVYNQIKDWPDRGDSGALTQ